MSRGVLKALTMQVPEALLLLLALHAQLEEKLKLLPLEVSQIRHALVLQENTGTTMFVPRSAHLVLKEQ